jgi:DNA-binding response OmpR family regulator
MTKVAIVEDDKIMLSLLQTLMEFEGFQVVYIDQLDNLEELIGTLQREKADLLLLDVYLNQQDGFEILRALRRDKTFESMRILACSGRELSRECYREGADGFIMKPYMPQELIEQIHHIIGK